MNNWKRLFIRAAGFGFGTAIALALIVGSFAWYSTRPKPWNEHALTATFTKVQFEASPNETSFVVQFNYDIQNNTDSTYRLTPYSLVLMARSSSGSLTKEWSHRQTSEPTLTGPAFIPAHSKAEVILRTTYLYPDDFTADDKADMAKVDRSMMRRLSELTGIVIFDEPLHYRIDLDAPWQEWDAVKKLANEN